MTVLVLMHTACEIVSAATPKYLFYYENFGECMVSLKNLSEAECLLLFYVLSWESCSPGTPGLTCVRIFLYHGFVKLDRLFAVLCYVNKLYQLFSLARWDNDMNGQKLSVCLFVC